MHRNDLRSAALDKGRSVEEIAPPVPTPETDAAPPGDTSTKFIFLAGAIKYWWLHKCPKCNRLFDDRSLCAHGDTLNSIAKVWTVQLWDSPEHQKYLKWRRDLRAALIENGYLTYAPHEAFKGRWDERAQAVNDAGIAVCDLMVVLSDVGWISEGTDAEVYYARTVNTPVIWTPPSLGLYRAVMNIKAKLADS